MIDPSAVCHCAEEPLIYAGRRPDGQFCLRVIHDPRLCPMDDQFLIHRPTVPCPGCGRFGAHHPTWCARFEDLNRRSKR